jgi:hypothetical protein
VRHLLIALVIAVTTSTANAQYPIWNSNIPAPGGAYYISTPPFYNGLAFNNGVITAFPVYPRYGYPAYYGYPPYPSPYPQVASPPVVGTGPGFNPGYNPYPQIWRP